MVFPQRGEENLLRRTTSCKNFQPNMFNKIKCQNCFRTREAHELDSDAANKKPKKVILCGYLFVAPGLDPENPASRSRKWQRRFFVIYETGELCYQLDDNPSTTPQATINMYTCTEVYNAKNSIGHEHSMGVVTPDGTLFIKAETHEEKNSWFIVLSEYPKINQEAEKHRRRKKKKEEREAGSSGLPARIDTSKEGVSTSSSDTKPTSTSLGRMSSFKENIQPPKDTLPDPSTVPGSRVSHLRHSDLNFRRSRSLRENVRKSRESLDEEEDSSHSHSDVASGEERDKASTEPPISRTRVISDRLARRHTSPIKHVDYPTPNIAKLRQSDRKAPPKQEVYSSDEEIETLEKGDRNVTKSEYTTETLHRNNNNVYKSDPKETGSSSYIPTRKNSSGDGGGSGRSSRRSSTADKSPTAALKQSESPETAVLSDEEIANLDLTKRGRMRLSKLHGDGENQSPSKRTIEKRRHARERRTRHTMDGSIQLIPVLDNDKQLEENKENRKQKLKRSNSDPSLADTEDAVQRQEIAEIFPELYHLKSGWLNLMGEIDEDWSKHYFVLKENKLSYYKDYKDDVNDLEGSFDLAGSMEASDFTIGRNYGFKVKMRTQDDLVLSAMTSAIRTKWVSALNKAIQTATGDSCKSSVDEGSLTPRIEEISESVPVKKDGEDLTQVDSNKIESEEGETKMRAPSQRIRDSRKSRKPPLIEPRLSSESDVFLDAVECLERKQPEGRSESPEPVGIDTQTGVDISEAWEEVVDALKARLKVVEDENAALKVKNLQLQEKVEAIKYPQENSAEVELLNQIEKLVKVRSKLEHDMEEQSMQLKQSRNAADLADQRNQELKEQVASINAELEHARGDYGSLQHRFEQLVADLREMETERSAARTRRKEERDKTVDVIERLNTRIDELERENVEAKEEVRQRTRDVERLQDQCADLERRLALPAEATQEELVIVEQERKVKTAVAPSVLAGLGKEHEVGSEGGSSGGRGRVSELEERLDTAERENKSLMAQLQGANRSAQMLKEKLRAKEEMDVRENASKDLEQLRSEIGEREEEIEELGRRLALVEEGRAGAESKAERLAQELARGHQRVKEVEGMLTQEQQSRLDTEDAARALRVDRDTLSESLTRYESQIRDLTVSNNGTEKVSDNHSQEVEELRKELKLAMEERGKLAEESDRVRQEREESRKEIEAKEEVLSLLQGEMKRVKGEWSKHRREVERLRHENEDLSGRLDSAGSESRSLRDRVGELESRLQREGREGTDSAVGGMPRTASGPVVQLREELVRERSSSDAALKNLELEMISKREELQVVSDQAEDYQKQLQLLTDALKHKAEAVIKLQAELARRDAALAAATAAPERGAGSDPAKAERLEKELRRLRGQLEKAQGDFDSLEIAHRQLREQQTQSEADHVEEVRRMGERIQDLIVKLSAAEKKVSNVDDVLREHETLHQQSLSDVKESYAIKMRSMEETRRKEQENDAEALATALEAVKRVYSEQLQQELQVIQAGGTKDVDAMLRRHKDVVTHMNKDWVIMSSKFSGLCRENARLTAVIGGLQDTLGELQASVKDTQEANRTRLEDLAATLKSATPADAKERGPVEDERLRMLNITLKLRELELKCTQDELKALQSIQEASQGAPGGQEGEPKGAVGGSEQYLNSGLKVSAL